MQRRPLGQGLKKATGKVTLEHKIKLKKRLAKAYKTADVHQSENDFEEPGSPEPAMVASVQKALDVKVGKARNPYLTATKVPQVQHQAHKPDPLQRARQAQAEVEAARLADRTRREEEIQAALQRKAEQNNQRREKHKKMTARTRKGQPVLSNQIDSLLEKVQKNYS